VDELSNRFKASGFATLLLKDPINALLKQPSVKKIKMFFFSLSLFVTATKYARVFVLGKLKYLALSSDSYS
jgi:hypothetical protein